MLLLGAVKKYAMTAVFLAVIGSALWLYYTDSQAKLKTMAESNARLEVALQAQKRSINQLQQGIETAMKANQELARNLQLTQKNLQQRLDLLNVDLQTNSRQDPQTVEDIVNEQQGKLWDEIERDTVLSVTDLN